MQYHQTEFRTREDGDRVVGPDRDHPPEPTAAEYRRIAAVASEQQAPDHDRLAELIAGRGR